MNSINKKNYKDVHQPYSNRHRRSKASRIMCPIPKKQCVDKCSCKKIFPVITQSGPGDVCQNSHALLLQQPKVDGTQHWRSGELLHQPPETNVAETGENLSKLYEYVNRSPQLSGQLSQSSSVKVTNDETENLSICQALKNKQRNIVRNIYQRIIDILQYAKNLNLDSISTESCEEWKRKIYLRQNKPTKTMTTKRLQKENRNVFPQNTVSKTSTINSLKSTITEPNFESPQQEFIKDQLAKQTNQLTDSTNQRTVLFPYREHESISSMTTEEFMSELHVPNQDNAESHSEMKIDSYIYYPQHEASTLKYISSTSPNYQQDRQNQLYHLQNQNKPVTELEEVNLYEREPLDFLPYQQGEENQYLGNDQFMPVTEQEEVNYYEQRQQPDFVQYQQEEANQLLHVYDQFVPVPEQDGVHIYEKIQSDPQPYNTYDQNYRIQSVPQPYNTYDQNYRIQSDPQPYNTYDQNYRIQSDPQPITYDQSVDERAKRILEMLTKEAVDYDHDALWNRVREITQRLSYERTEIQNRNFCEQYRSLLKKYCGELHQGTMLGDKVCIKMRGKFCFFGKGNEEAEVPFCCVNKK